MKIKNIILLIAIVTSISITKPVFGDNAYRQEMLEQMQGQHHGEVRALSSDTEEENRRAAEFMQSDEAKHIMSSYYNKLGLGGRLDSATSINKQENISFDGPELLKENNCSESDNDKPNALTYIIILLFIGLLLKEISSRIKKDNNTEIKNQLKQNYDQNLKVECYIYSDDDIRGPFPLLELKDKLASGELQSGTQVCREGDDKWSNLEDVINRELGCNKRLSEKEHQNDHGFVTSILAIIAFIAIPYFNGFRLSNGDKWENLFHIAVFLSNHILALIELLVAFYFISKLDFKNFKRNATSPSPDNLTKKRSIVMEMTTSLDDLCIILKTTVLISRGQSGHGFSH
jgi:hypothetical protein